MVTVRLRMHNSTSTRYTTLTDVGRVRGHNEDAFAVDPALGLYVVCDGMGGHAGGEVASREAAANFLAWARQLQRSASPADRLVAAISGANRAVYEMSVRQPRLRGMGSTIVALEVAADGRSVSVAHAGDSRCYRLRDGVLHRLTDDHSLVEEQLRSGVLTPEEARRSHLRNVITRVVGSHPQVSPEVAQFQAEGGDLYLLCSDGLNRDLADADLLGILQRHRHSLPHTARVLIDAANLLGGGDNITVVLVEIAVTAETEP